jgi:2-heptyl-1-hydroxyquinolin-4(1H)-one methyltransferase
VAAREKYLQSVVHAAAPRASSCVLVLDHSAVLDSQVNAVTLDELHDVVSLPRLVALPTRTHFS